MAFVDGENLLNRFEAMVGEGLKHRDHTPQGGMAEPIKYDPKKFVWSPYTIANLYGGDILERVTYYTTMTGDVDALEDLNTAIGSCQTREIPYASIGQHQLRVLPKVFKKEARRTKTKSVDISICVDVMEYVKNDALDAVYLVSGDVDYRPLIEAVMRAGKRAYVASLSSGRGLGYSNVPDRYVNLDSLYFFGMPNALIR
ncbi:NYN domain-containing protein [Duganella sp. FT109W]|uniref:NYN domain-containing protein n=1 Tax=Duganella margarita TaxID=2692170 RepID=A0ABW9WP75_9BURK|nr:NYN domain-containing protein [Duganella margarita]MYN42758.1 NYN domain-containing protein [Duganella margarita]